MTRLLLLAFILTPIIEIAGFITVGSWIGLWPTLLLVFLTAVAGTILVRAQSLSIIGRINQQLTQGQIPGRALFDGLCLFAAALLLLTPGFFTDVIGLSLLLPPVRSFLAPRILNWATSRGSVSFGTTGQGFGGQNNQGSVTPDIIDGEAEVVEPTSDRPLT